MIVTGMVVPLEKMPMAGECGFWMPWGKNIDVKAAKTRSDVSDMAVILHEMVEAFLCIKHGVAEKDVSEWDQKWHDAEMKGEPGDHPSAPYHGEHVAATAVERAFVTSSGMTWEEHDANVEALFERKV